MIGWEPEWASEALVIVQSKMGKSSATVFVLFFLLFFKAYMCIISTLVFMTYSTIKILKIKSKHNY